MGGFYPEDIKPGERLAFYARHFDAVEINNSFYHLPKREQFDKWQHAVPEWFVFAVKGSRYLTHRKKLKEARRFMPVQMEPIRHQPKIGAVIFQLPPHWHRNMDRLKDFLRSLPKRQRFAIEFRDPDWHTAEVYRLLKEYNVAFCLFEKAELRSPRIATADFIYIRLHGRKEGYKGCYSAATLTQWLHWIEDQHKDTYIFFDNTDEKMYAVDNASTFRHMAERASGVKIRA